MKKEIVQVGGRPLHQPIERTAESLGTALHSARARIRHDALVLEGIEEALIFYNDLAVLQKRAEKLTAEVSAAKKSLEAAEQSKRELAGFDKELSERRAAARAEAKRLEDAAKARAQGIVAAARNQASELIAEAKREGAEIKKGFDALKGEYERIKQQTAAGRAELERVRSEIQGELANV